MTAGEVLLLLAAALGLGLLLRGILLLHRLRRWRRGGWPARTFCLPGWELRWPAWWPRPRRQTDMESAWVACPLDHGASLWLLPTPPVGPDAEGGLRRAFAALGARADDWQVEEFPGVHGPVRAIESRATIGTERAWIWAAFVPGPPESAALLLRYRSGVLFGLADGCWLQEVAATARAVAR